LRDAGLIDDTEAPLDPMYYEFIAGLDSATIDSVISLAERIDKAGIPRQPLTADSEGIVHF
jgi:hypothetical protein